MPSLKIHFQFLCAFVPDQPFDDPDGPPPKNATVLLHDLSALDHDELDPHFAHLQYHESYGPDETYDEREVRNRLLKFDQEEVTFRPDGRDPASNGLNVNLNPTSDDPRSILWLVRMEEVAPGKELVKSALLSGSGPHDPPIAARVKLTEGELSSGRRTPEIIRLRGGFERRIALHVLLEIPFKEFIDVHLTKFDDQNAVRKLSLRPDEDDADDPDSVVIFIRNSEHKYRFGDDRGDGPYGGEDRDFRHYYDLVENVSADDARLVPVAPGGDGSHGTCSPVGLKKGTGS